MHKPKSKRTAAQSPLVDRQKLLDEFELLTDADVATVLGVDLKTLRNRPASKKPKFFKSGRQRLCTKGALRDFLETTVVTP